MMGDRYKCYGLPPVLAVSVITVHGLQDSEGSQQNRTVAASTFPILPILPLPYRPSLIALCAFRPATELSGDVWFVSPSTPGQGIEC